MKNYKIVLINNEGNIRDIYEERNGSNYIRMNGEIPLELRKIAEPNKSFVKNFRLNKFEIKIYCD